MGSSWCGKSTFNKYPNHVWNSNSNGYGLPEVTINEIVSNTKYQIHTWMYRISIVFQMKTNAWSSQYVISFEFSINLIVIDMY